MVDLKPDFDERVVSARSFPPDYLVERVNGDKRDWVQNPYAATPLRYHHNSLSNTLIIGVMLVLILAPLTFLFRRGKLV